MNQIRYKQRICEDEQKIADFLSSARVATISMIHNNTPYSIPVNFVCDNKNFYFHSMGSGKKIDCLINGPEVCINVYAEYGTVKDNVPCKVDTSYFSVIIFGQAKKIENFAESADILQKIVDKYVPGLFSSKLSSNMVEKYRSAHDNNAVAVFKIAISSLTAKENIAPSSDIF